MEVCILYKGDRFYSGCVLIWKEGSIGYYQSNVTERRIEEGNATLRLVVWVVTIGLHFVQGLFVQLLLRDKEIRLFLYIGDTRVDLLVTS